MRLCSVRGRFLLVLVVLAAGLLSSLASLTAHAMDRAKAKDLYLKGTAAYKLGEFREAVDLFKASYRESLDAALLYNIAQAYRQSGDRGQALFFYRRFLHDAAPGEPNRPEAEKQVKEMEALLAASKPPDSWPTGAPPAQVEPQAPATAPDEPPHVPPPAPLKTEPAPAPGPVVTSAPAAPVGTSPKRVLGWSLVGVGAASAIAGLFVILEGQSKLDDAVNQAGQANAAHDMVAYQRAAGTYSDGTTQRTTGRFIFAGGGVAIACGVALLLLTPPNSESRPATTARLSPWIGIDGTAVASGGVNWSGRW